MKHSLKGPAVQPGNFERQGGDVLLQGYYLVREDRLQTAAEVAEVVPLLMHLDPLTIVLDLREHAIRTLFHCIFDGLAGLGLGKEKANVRTLQQGLLSRVWGWDCQDGTGSGTDSGQTAEGVMYCKGLDNAVF